jgi:hypothetical protein
MKWLAVFVLAISGCAAQSPHDEVWDEVERSLPKSNESEWPVWAPRIYLPQAIHQPEEAKPTGWRSANNSTFGIGLQWRLTF